MKEKFFTIFLIVLSVLMLNTNINVKAESGGYSLLVRKGELTESFSTSDVTSEVKSIFDNKVSFNNTSIKVNGISVDRFSVTDAQGALLGPINFTITGDNTFKVLSISSCSLSVSGSGTLKFVPSAFGEEGIITDVEQQKVFISSKIKTSLPVFYEDGYVYINKKVEETPSKEPEKEVTDQNSEVVNKDESTNKNETTTKEEIKDSNVVNKNENNSTVNDNSDKNSSQSTKPSNGNKNEDKKNDKTDEVINDDVNNNVVTSDDTSIDSSEQEFEKDEDINIGTDSSNEIENIEDEGENKKSNIPLYVGIGTIGAVGVACAGVFIFKKMKH